MYRPVFMLSSMDGVFALWCILWLLPVDGFTQSAADRGCASFEWQYNDPDSGMHLARALIREGETTDSDLARAWGYHGLGANLRALERYDSAMICQRLAAGLASSLPDSVLWGRALNSLGMVHKKQHAFDSAAYYYLAGLRIRADLSDTLGMARGLSNLGSIYRQRNQLDTATSYYLDAITYYDALRSAQVAGPRLNLGNIYFDLGQWTEALTHYRAARSAYDRLDNKRWSALADYSLGRVHFQLEDLDSAEHCFLRAIPVLEQLQAEWDLADAKVGLGAVYKARSTYQRAIPLYQEARAIFVRMGDRQGQAVVLNNIAEVHEAQGALELALDHYRQSAEAFEELEDLRHLKTVYFHISDLHRQLQQDHPALVYYMKYKETDDSLRALHREETIQRLNFEYKAAKNEANVEAANRKAAEQEALRYRWMLVLGLLAFVMMVVAVLIYAWQRKQSRMADARLDALLQKKEAEFISALINSQETERTRIGRDLHDNVGARLSTLKHRLEGLGTSGLDDRMKAIVELLDQTVQEVRGISHNMVSGVLVNYGLIPAIRDLAASVRSENSLRINVLSFGVNQDLPDSVELYVYRIVQELISNILRHAEASEATIRFEQQAAELLVEVRDDGKGFDLEAQSAGMGLANIHNRVQHLNGNINIDTQKGEGTTVCIKVPLDQLVL